MTFFITGLVYHPHHRPLTSPVAALLDLSASLHRNAPRSFPTPAGVLWSLDPAFASHRSNVTHTSAVDSMANALTIPPIHVEHVADAICVALTSSVRGVVDVERMRELIGWGRNGEKGDGSDKPEEARKVTIARRV